MGCRVVLVSGQDKAAVEGFVSDLLASVQAPEEIAFNRLRVRLSKPEEWKRGLQEVAMPPMPIVAGATRAVVFEELDQLKTMDVSWQLEQALRAGEQWAKGGEAGNLLVIGMGNEKVDKPGTALEPFTNRTKKGDQRVFKVFGVWEVEQARKEIREILSDHGLELKPRLVAVIHEMVEGQVSLVRTLAEKLALLQGQGKEITSGGIRSMLQSVSVTTMPTLVDALHARDRRAAQKALYGLLRGAGPWEVAAQLGGFLHKDALLEGAWSGGDRELLPLLGITGAKASNRLWHMRQRHDQLRGGGYYLGLVKATIAFRERVVDGLVTGDREQRQELVRLVLSAMV